MGPLLNDLFAMAAMVGQGGGQRAEDVLVGFARAGITATSKESVIDISDEILSDQDGVPTFTVWCGADDDLWVVP